MNDFRLTSQDIKILSEAGEAAPSGANAQPWNVLIYSNRIEIKLDPIRFSSFLDVNRLASIFGLGCFAQNVLIAANSLGIEYECKFIGYTSIEEPLVEILFTGRAESPISESLYPYIAKRVTNRRLYDGTIIDEDILSNLRNMISDFSLQFNLNSLVNSKKKEEAADILGEADYIRFTNDELFTEMINEFRWSEEEVTSTKDGFDLKTLELPRNGEKMLALLKDYPFLRSLLPKKALADFARPLILNCSHLCCISSKSEITPEVMFLAGQAVESLWLNTTKLNLAFQPWTVMNFILIRATYFPNTGFSEHEEEMILRLGKLFRTLFNLENDEFPLFIFRLSKAKPPSARSLRIPWKTYTRIIE